MDYNPYAAPAAPPLPPLPAGPAGGQPGEPQPWEAGEVLSLAWEAFQPNAPLLIGAWFTLGMLVLPLSVVPTVLKYTHAVAPGAPEYAVQGFCVMGNLIIESFLNVGITRIVLAVARRQQPSFAELFSGSSHFFRMLGLSILTRLILVCGCCVFGCLALYTGLCLANFYVVDQDLGPIDALEAAWRATDGIRAEVLIYSILAAALGIAGALFCGVGLFVAVPVAMLGFAFIYLRVSGRGASPVRSVG